MEETRRMKVKTKTRGKRGERMNIKGILRDKWPQLLILNQVTIST